MRSPRRVGFFTMKSFGGPVVAHSGELKISAKAMSSPRRPKVSKVLGPWPTSRHASSSRPTPFLAPMVALDLTISMLALIVVVFSLGLWSRVEGAPQVPCYFIFCDSLVDNGNNNQLQSLARAD
ncbi:hypothetical protein JHK86_028071 [Glycine max]|nr:hypothetical protein JHK86_028071 [Glycine max]